ncbi:hypothetical protein [Legionella quinlivanii]|uniref:hypothetical protein n=1 Tax=Legionella quinlivanii TaxID=45073 RepID=UPI000CDF0907|nr:hypothetical protein [Legionella quinlivanii]
MSSALEIVSDFKEVLAAGDALRSHLLSTKPRSVWINVPDTSYFANDVLHFAKALLDFYPSHHRNPQATSAYQGALGGLPITLQLAEAFNAAKDRFHENCKSYMNEQKQRETLIIHMILRNAGFPPVKLKQVYRHIPILNFHPRLISYCRLRHNSKIKVSPSEAQQRLKKAGKGAHIDIQLDKITQQDKLVIHRETHSLWAANISTFKDSSNRVTTRKLLTSMPVIYLHDKQYPEPRVKYSEQRERHQRRDKRIENDVFLKSIHAYRYKSDPS